MTIFKSFVYINTSIKFYILSDYLSQHLNIIKFLINKNLRKMVEAIFNTQLIMSILIAIVWIIPDISFPSATNRKYKYREE